MNRELRQEKDSDTHKLSMFFIFSALCLLSNDIYDYHYVSQGKVTVASIDDKEEMDFTHVRKH